MKRMGLAGFVALFLSSCSSYHWYKPPRHLSFYVPFIQNDTDGQLTTSVIQVLAQSGFDMDVRADYQLEIDLITTRLSPVGYTYGFDDKGRPTTALYANESRHEWVCRVAVKDSKTQTYLIQPQQLRVSGDLDYQTDDMPYNETQFSVGQLNIREEALEGSKVVLRKKMAQAVADWLALHRRDFSSAPL